MVCHHAMLSALTLAISEEEGCCFCSLSGGLVKSCHSRTQWMCLGVTPQGRSLATDPEVDPNIM
jgi:hypothetical protein